MAATPPLQITATPQTPPTPLHGATYDRVPTRQSARLRQRAASHNSQNTPEHATSRVKGTRSVTAPSSSALASPTSRTQSPRLTPRKPARRAQILSPSSPNTDSTPPKPSRANNTHLQPFLSATTAMSEGMLPTPVKTPKKKSVPGVNATARALFQDTHAGGEDIAPSPRRAREHRRYNGFSLESFAAEDDSSRRRVQIFTDNRDKVPEVDTTESNPFIEPARNGHGPRVSRKAGGSKRRKVTGEGRLDPQVQQALKRDDGMVYVFRGKKVYRRFDDTGDDEEEIDEEDLGLLEHVEDGESKARPLRTLTRKSIRPTRLFQSEVQKVAREQEQEEEAPTDVDEASTAANSFDVTTAKDTANDLAESSQSSTTVTRRRSADTAKKASPFGSWKRIKSGGKGSASSSKGQKRTASQAVEEESGGIDLVEASRPRKSRG